jgi:hypothetical protein
MTDDNGNKTRAAIRRIDEGVEVDVTNATYLARSQSIAVSHWNCRRLDDPMVNRRVGVLMRFQIIERGRDAVRRTDGTLVDATRCTVPKQ